MADQGHVRKPARDILLRRPSAGHGIAAVLLLEASYEGDRYSDADIDGLPAKVQSGEYTLANVITDAKKMQDQGVVQPGYGFYPRPANGPIYQSMLRRLYQLGFEYRRLGSAAVGLVRAANGVADLYYEAHLNAWDVLAGALIASEAGARIWMPPLERMLAEGGAVAACAPALAGYLGFLSADTAASAPEIAQSA